MMGAERRSMVMTEDEKKMTAYHEAGHALVAVHCPASNPIHKATIIPRGRSLGMVVRLPERDEYSYSREKMHADLAIAMGGRVAEEIIFGYDKVSSGASGDIQSATILARKMVTKWGLSDKLGPLQYAEDEQEVFLGHSVTQTQKVSAKTAELIDEEIRKFVDGAYGVARKILTDNLDDLHAIGKALLEFETLTGDEINDILDGKDIDRTPPDDSGAKENRRKVTSSVPSAGRSKSDDGGGAPVGPEPQPEG